VGNTEHNYSARSMTAFAKTQVDTEYGRFSWEIRSVNQRYLDISPRLPDAFRHLESALRQSIKNAISRGKLDVSLNYDIALHQDKLTINHTVFEPLTEAISQVQQALPEATQVNPLDILTWPGVLQEPQDTPSSEADKVVLDALNQSINALIEHRTREGQALAKLILERCHHITQQLQHLEPVLPDILAAHSTKLKTKIMDLSGHVDESRWHQEVALIAQKTDITEEIDRLYTHLKEVTHILTQTPPETPIGRRLDFLMQELNREANTLGSKSNDTRITQTSVELKVLIEQMREQVQNIE